jgi:hypothetical protein
MFGMVATFASGTFLSIASLIGGESATTASAFL